MLQFRELVSLLSTLTTFRLTMYHLIYDPTDFNHMFMLLDDDTSSPYLVAYHWFSHTTISKAFIEPCRLTIGVTEYLDSTPWEILTTFPTQPTTTELTTFIYSKPELLI